MISVNPVRFLLAFFLLNLVLAFQKLYQIRPSQLAVLGWGSQVYLFQFDYVPNYDRNFAPPVDYLGRKAVNQAIKNNKIKHSGEVKIVQPQLDNKTFPMLIQYIKDIKSDAQFVYMPEQSWTMLQYKQTSFFKHCDRMRPINNTLVQIGTQILIPPGKFNNVSKGGELIIYENYQYIQVLPDKQLWTLVILPLGTRHQVKMVTEGIRTSIRKSLYVKNTRKFRDIDQTKCGIYNKNALKRTKLSLSNGENNQQL